VASAPLREGRTARNRREASPRFAPGRPGRVVGERRAAQRRAVPAPQGHPRDRARAPRARASGRAGADEAAARPGAGGRQLIAEAYLGLDQARVPDGGGGGGREPGGRRRAVADLHARGDPPVPADGPRRPRRRAAHRQSTTPTCGPPSRRARAGCWARTSTRGGWAPRPAAGSTRSPEGPSAPRPPPRRRGWPLARRPRCRCATRIAAEQHREVGPRARQATDVGIQGA